MTLRVVCRNGHSLTVNDSLAGKLGLCPVCKVQVQVPQIKDNRMSEDAIMDILGPEQVASSTDGVSEKPSAPVAAGPEDSRPALCGHKGRHQVQETPWTPGSTFALTVAAMSAAARR